MLCEEAREHLLALLDDEACAVEVRDDVGAHVARCPACADELEALERTMRRLDAWTPPQAATEGSVPTVLEKGRAGSGRARLGWIAAAAGFALLAASLLVHVEVRTYEGGVLVSLGRPAPAAETGIETLEPVLREVIEREVREGQSFALAALGGALGEWERDLDERHVALLGAIDALRRADLEHFDLVLNAIARDAQDRDRQVWAALDHVARTVEMNHKELDP